MEPRASGITSPKPGLQHDGRSYHTGTTSLQHNGRSYHTGTTGFGTTEIAQRAFQKRDSPHPNEEKVCDRLATDAERAAHQPPPRRAARESVKKGTISRAEGGQLQAPVGPPLQ